MNTNLSDTVRLFVCPSVCLSVWLSRFVVVRQKKPPVNDETEMDKMSHCWYGNPGWFQSAVVGILENSLWLETKYYYTSSFAKHPVSLLMLETNSKKRKRHIFFVCLFPCCTSRSAANNCFLLRCAVATGGPWLSGCCRCGGGVRSFLPIIFSPSQQIVSLTSG